MEHARLVTPTALAAVPFFFLFLLLCLHADAATTLLQGQSLGRNDKLVSPNGAFLLAFFVPRGGGDGSRAYLGVLYARAAEETVPWVANRDAPVSASSALYSATVTSSGQLQILEGDRVVWQTSNTPPSSSSGNNNNFTLTIQDTGNLVLGNGGQNTAPLWQSFDHPTDTFLPGMSITLDRRDGAVASNTLFTSWASPGDPAPGNFTLGQDPLGSAQLYIWRHTPGNTPNNSGIKYWRSGQWANTKFVGIPWRSLYVYGFRLAGDASRGSGTRGGVMSYTFSAYNESQFRFVLKPNGTETCYMLLESTGAWEVVWSQPTIPCHAYNTCGPNAGCAAADDHGRAAACKCLQGFEPRSEEEYYGRGNWTRGCVRSKPLTCSERNVEVSGGDAFAALPGVKLPDFAVWESTVGGADACKGWCLANCTCGAYSYSDGTGCLTWSGRDLVDVYKFPNGEGYDLHIKVPASLLGMSFLLLIFIFFDSKAFPALN